MASRSSEFVIDLIAEANFIYFTIIILILSYPSSDTSVELNACKYIITVEQYD